MSLKAGGIKRCFRKKARTHGFGFAVARVLGLFDAVSLGALFAVAAAAAVARGLLRYAEQSCNHFIAFKLLALIRDRVFGALRRLCPAKLEGCDKGDLISVITGDIELLEVFYAHTVSPVCIAVLFCAAMIALIGRYHALLGFLAAVAYLTVGVAVPLVAAHYSRDEANVKRAAGRSGAATGAIILIFDLLMLFCAAHLCGFRGALVCTPALMSSFEPCVALSALGTTLQSTLAAGNRVLNILDETPQTQEITGKAPAAFGDAAARNVTFSYDAQSILNDLSVDFPQGKIASLPQGYDTPVGELGGTLSGGERQRLGLARAFLHDAPLLLLDEPTANLDSLNEGAILKSLHEARSGKTIVLVSHRASTVAAADVCYRIESGRIVHENS